MIDTLEFAQRMTAAGMAEPVAKQLAHELREGLPSGELATKADLAELRSATKTDLAELKTELKTDIANARASIIIWVAVFVALGQVLPTMLQFLKGFH